MRSKGFYQRRLNRYFRRHYLAYDEEIAWCINTAINKWRFYIPSIKKLVTLVCDDEGNVREE